MKRNDNQHKTVLTDGEQALLAEALLVASAQMRANATVARELGNLHLAATCQGKAEDMMRLYAYSPEVVRVAVTTEVPAYVPRHSA